MQNNPFIIIIIIIAVKSLRDVQVVMNVLNSAKKVSLERLQRMLILFGQHLNPKYDRSEDELLSYLDVLVEQGVLKCEGSQYSKAD